MEAYLEKTLLAKIIINLSDKILFNKFKRFTEAKKVYDNEQKRCTFNGLLEDEEIQCDRILAFEYYSLNQVDKFVDSIKNCSKTISPRGIRDLDQITKDLKNPLQYRKYRQVIDLELKPNNSNYIDHIILMVEKSNQYYFKVNFNIHLNDNFKNKYESIISNNMNSIFKISFNILSSKIIVENGPHIKQNKLLNLLHSVNREITYFIFKYIPGYFAYNENSLPTMEMISMKNIKSSNNEEYQYRIKDILFTHGYNNETIYGDDSNSNQFIPVHYSSFNKFPFIAKYISHKNFAKTPTSLLENNFYQCYLFMILDRLNKFDREMYNNFKIIHLGKRKDIINLNNIISNYNFIYQEIDKELDYLKKKKDTFQNIMIYNSKKDVKEYTSYLYETTVAIIENLRKRIDDNIDRSLTLFNSFSNQYAIKTNRRLQLAAIIISVISLALVCYSVYKKNIEPKYYIKIIKDSHLEKRNAK